MLEIICTAGCNTCRKLVGMLDRFGVSYTYREYRERPLSAAELEEVLALLGLKPRDVFRRHDRAARELGLTGDESDDELLRLMSAHPTLLQRPIAIYDGRAVIGRPVDRVFDLIGGLPALEDPA